MKPLLVLPFIAAAESHYQGVASSKIGETLVVITCLVVIASFLWTFVEKIKGGTPQKREVSFSQEFATKEELKQAHGRMNRERLELDAKIDNLKEQADQLAEKMDEKIEALSDKVDEKVEGLSQRVDLVPHRTITMLRETKGLIG